MMGNKLMEQLAIGLMMGLVFIVVLGALMLLVGRGIDTVAQYQEWHDRCLKEATNGYEARQCK